MYTSVISSPALGSLLAICCFPLLILLHSWGFRLKKPESKGLLALLAASIFYISCIYFLLVKILLTSHPVHLGGGFLSALLLIFGYMELYSMILRGFSLQLLSSLYRSPGLNFTQILASYAGGRGIDWLWEKRLRDLQKLRLLERHSTALSAQTPRGVWAGRLANYYKKLFYMGKGG